MGAAPSTAAGPRSFTHADPCPVCGGHDSLPRGKGIRCFGFLSSDGLYAHCARPGLAGKIQQHGGSGCYPHRLRGACNCGTEHGPEEPKRTNGSAQKRGAKKKRATPWSFDDADVSATHTYTDDVQVVRFTQAARERGRPKCMSRHLVDGRWYCGLGPHRSSDLALYRSAEVVAELVQGGAIYIVEGEGDADAVVEATGQLAATNIGGAMKFREHHAATLAAALQAGAPRARIRVVADVDDQGEGLRHALDVRAKLIEVGAAAATITVLRPAPGQDLGDHLAAGRDLAELEEVKVDDPPAPAGIERSYLEVAPTRRELEELAAAPPITPIATHLYYPNTATVLGGDTNMGKTTAILRAKVDLVYGREPWTGKPDRSREPLRLLMVSKDDTTLSLVRKVREFAPDDDWMDGRLVLIGKEKQPLALDDHGLEVLGNTLADGRFDGFTVDPYQHFLPPGCKVNDDDAAEHMVGSLERITNSLGIFGAIVAHVRKRPHNAKNPLEMTRNERLTEVRGSSVLTQLARAVATLWEVEPARRMLDALVNDLPPLSELHFETSSVGDFGVRWELAGPPTDTELEEIRGRFLELEPDTYNLSDLARCAFELKGKRTVPGSRRTQVKHLARRFAEEEPGRFLLVDNGKKLKVLDPAQQVLGDA